MRKMIAMVMAATMALSLTACGSSSKPAETAAPATEAAAPAEGKTEAAAPEEKTEAPEGAKVLEGKKVGFAQTDSMSAWRTTETDSIKEYVENAGGEFIVKDAGGDIATQESDIRDLVAAGVDYLVVAPLENNGLQGALQEAMESNIPVILVDRAIDGDAGTHYTTAIMSDFIWEGEQCAKALTEALPDGGNVVIINGGYDSSTSTDRQDGFVKGLDSSKFKVVAEQDGEWLMDKAQAVMENIIQAQGGENIDAVFCVTDDMVQGAMNAIEAAGLKPGEDILTLGIDGTRAAFEAVEDGRQLASCTCSPYFGEIVVDTISKIIGGEEVPAHITNEDTLYTKDNVKVELGF
ncbi:ABC transporter substrate-binding protein [[Clostridium] symbiosum]|uniref:ABC transporter substrate-binding protein n=1 Tax=Clostridium symbiosum TaxID=1512 RepID=UPI001D07D70F|nr:ABC transporter substrate-binding protein [[Clostridium] symbiosum]MCB6610996.1 ABC transporter substrate-binding protein [[Clostridium] symbiosum]MCB6931540.1 ABC transporter substrate-binding protein [[Clostridium] symbiosum]